MLQSRCKGQLHHSFQSLGSLLMTKQQLQCGHLYVCQSQKVSRMDLTKMLQCHDIVSLHGTSDRYEHQLLGWCKLHNFLYELTMPRFQNHHIKQYENLRVFRSASGRLTGKLGLTSRIMLKIPEAFSLFN